jgi:hypothetical protein
MPAAGATQALSAVYPSVSFEILLHKMITNLIHDFY